jgi:hypothetical protein
MLYLPAKADGVNRAGVMYRHILIESHYFCVYLFEILGNGGRLWMPPGGTGDRWREPGVMTRPGRWPFSADSMANGDGAHARAICHICPAA